MSLLYCIFATFGLSSAWLYSPGFEKIRNWWTENTGPFAALGYCQLCCSFWISIPWVFIWFNTATIVGFTGLMLAAAGASWMLGGITNFFLWGKAWFERYEK